MDNKDFKHFNPNKLNKKYIINVTGYGNNCLIHSILGCNSVQYLECIQKNEIDNITKRALKFREKLEKKLKEEKLPFITNDMIEAVKNNLFLGPEILEIIKDDENIKCNYIIIDTLRNNYIIINTNNTKTGILLYNGLDEDGGHYNIYKDPDIRNIEDFEKKYKKEIVGDEDDEDYIYMNNKNDEDDIYMNYKDDDKNSEDNKLIDNNVENETLSNDSSSEIGYDDININKEENETLSNESSSEIGCDDIYIDINNKENNENIENLILSNKLLSNESKKIYQNIRDRNLKFYLLVGYTQSGKTKEIPHLAYIYLKLGYPVFCFVYKYTNNQDMLINRCKEFCEKLKIKFDDYFCNISELKNIPKNFNYNKIYIGIGNENKIELSTESLIIIKSSNKKPILILDESDDSNLGEPNIKNPEKTGYNRNEREKSLYELYNKCQFMIGVSATPYANIYLENIYGPLKCENILYLPESDNYIGFKNKKCKIKTMIQDLYIQEIKNEDKTKGFIPYTKEQEKLFFNILDDAFQKQKNCKINKLKSIAINVGNLTCIHLYLKNLIIENPLYKNYAIIIINSDEINSMKIHSHSDLQNLIENTDTLIDYSICNAQIASGPNKGKICGKKCGNKYKGTGKCGRHQNIKFEISHLFSYKGDIIRFNSISDMYIQIEEGIINNTMNYDGYIFIGSNMFCRTIPLRSENNPNFKMGNFIYTSSLIYCCKEDKPIDIKMQSMGRITGIYPGHTKYPEEKNIIRLYTTAHIKDEILERMEQDKLIKNQIINPLNINKFISEFLPNLNTKQGPLTNPNKGHFIKNIIINNERMFSIEHINKFNNDFNKQFNPDKWFSNNLDKWIEINDSCTSKFINLIINQVKIGNVFTKDLLIDLLTESGFQQPERLFGNHTNYNDSKFLFKTTDHDIYELHEYFINILKEKKYL